MTPKQFDTIVNSAGVRLGGSSRYRSYRSSEQFFNAMKNTSDTVDLPIMEPVSITRRRDRAAAEEQRRLRREATSNARRHSRERDQLRRDLFDEQRDERQRLLDEGVPYNQLGDRLHELGLTHKAITARLGEKYTRVPFGYKPVEPTALAEAD